MPTVRLVLPVLLLLSSCSTLERLTGGGATVSSGQYTIERDEYGVPLIAGETDAAVAFGLGYAQAEDRFRQLEEDVMRAIGRAANLYGDVELANDLIVAAFEIPRLAQEEYAQEPEERRRIWDAFVAGLNEYVATHPEMRPRLLGRFEPWHLFALARFVEPGTVIDGVVLGDAGDARSPLPAGARAIARYDSSAVGAAGQGGASFAMAVAPARTEGGHALLLHGLDRSFYGAGQPYEAHLRSDEGWRVSGYTTLGSPVIRTGHSPHHAWAHTDAGGDTRDAWLLRFDHPTDSLAYRWGDEWRTAEVFADTVAVNTTTGVVHRPYSFLRTEYGPVVARVDANTLVAVQIARMQEGGALQQWYAMNRATTLEEFRGALANAALVGLGTVYADAAGSIYYVHGSAVPRRNTAVDPARPLDGSDPATAWDGYHSLQELPELLDPASGWIQSASGTPFLATASGYNLERSGYPVYMAPEGDTPRALRARQLLSANDSWTADTFEQASFDVQVPSADAALRRLINEYEQRGAVDPTGVLPLDDAIHQLREWDRSATVDSPEMTLYVTWQERLRSPFMSDDRAWPLTDALAWALERIERSHGSHDVAWGSVNRLVRAGSQPVTDSAGVALPGAPSWIGTLFGAGPAAPAYGGVRTLVSGTAWSSVVELGNPAGSRSVVVFGQSDDPASPHFFDQAALTAEGRMKVAADPARWDPQQRH